MVLRLVAACEARVAAGWAPAVSHALAAAAAAACDSHHCVGWQREAAVAEFDTAAAGAGH
jgi:hypothetical protein